MANNHHIVASEPIRVLTKNTLDESGDHLVMFGDNEFVEYVDHENEQCVYECTCGEEFGASKDDARDHLKAIRDSENGEAVTSPGEE